MGSRQAKGDFCVLTLFLPFYDIVRQKDRGTKLRYCTQGRFYRGWDKDKGVPRDPKKVFWQHDSYY